jgi:lipoprotein-anchoring transpeptidase ErfK/SrfK
MQDLAPARPSAFGGIAVVEGRLDFAWVVADRAKVWSDDRPKGKPVGERARFEVVTVREDRGPMARVGDGAWMLARDLARPVLASPPAEVAHPAERWIDVDTASQTLVAYEGVRPVYATLASTGRGPPETNVTPPGVHRIWVKMVMTDMDNVDREDVEEHYSMEDVPYVQFFDGAVALHGTYWHGDFGHARSHGCVNLAPLDARWLFSFTAPRLPAGWAAVYPTPLDPGTIVRVR